VFHSHLWALGVWLFHRPKEMFLGETKCDLSTSLPIARILSTLPRETLS
jgi:hypothetical protein